MKTLSLCIVVLFCAVATQAQQITKVKEVIASGATDATATFGGTTYHLRGTIGQAIIGPVSAVNAGTNDTVYQGFWTPGIANATGIEVSKSGPAPIDFTLDQNYPNPYSTTTLISFAVPNATHVLLQVYSMTGALVQTLVDGAVTPGRYNVTFDASSLSTGTYLYMLQAGGRLLTKRMVVIR